MPSASSTTSNRRNVLWAFAALGYVAAVLGLDALATLGVRWPWDWRAIVWGMPGGAKTFALLFWFFVPLAASLYWIEPGYFGVKRWRRVDLLILGGLLAAGFASVVVTRLSPTLRAAFPGIAHLSADVKWRYAIYNGVWIASWLPGWEFLHRYVLLRRLEAAWPCWGWLLIPVSETAYHLVWPTLLMPLGMFGFSLVVTYWARKRRNTLLPFVAHLAIELELAGFCLLI